MISEQRILELYDIAIPMADVTLRLLNDGLSVYDVLSVISEGLSFGEYTPSDNTTDEHRDMIVRAMERLRHSDRSALVSLYLDTLRSRGFDVTERSFLPPGYLDETFTYVRNGLADEAYDVFSQEFDDPKVRYSSSFRECARAVATREISYCLLPLEEKGGTRLPTVSEIIFRNDFRINSVIPVFGPDGSADMKYALLSNSFTVPQMGEDDDVYLEIRLGTDTESPLTEMFGAIDYFGMKLYRINTVTFDTEGESETYFSVVIKDGGKGFTSILTYFALFVRDFVPVGIYKNLE